MCLKCLKDRMMTEAAAEQAWANFEAVKADRPDRQTVFVWDTVAAVETRADRDRRMGVITQVGVYEYSPHEARFVENEYRRVYPGITPEVRER